MWLRAVFSSGGSRPSFRGPVCRDPGPGLRCGQLSVPCGFSAGRAFMWVPAGLPGPGQGLRREGREGDKHTLFGSWLVGRKDKRMGASRSK